ncbi:pyridoxal phosphate-dependent aminotransferase [Cumulibacter manganitolerans]|uniref:pyridoxal phosphate-dependent aminotransferase n=1 Tax=Cumulibacter manganitolerans TaxID=1884992 RepID=UPI001295AE93|nr:pyridoxal phosphate-dependent aminotransferase [Cumulibacter manganitolerans]
MRRPLLSARLHGFTSTIFAEMSALAVQTGAINLGQGFPDVDGPAQVREAAKAAIDGGANQYPPGPGIPSLLSAVAEHQHRFYGMRLDPASEVLVTTGATEAIAAAMLALLEPGDEVVVLEPYYDSYAATISMAGAVRKPVTLRAPHFALPRDELAAAVTDRTRLILLNTPHNPTGAVLSRADLEHVAALAVEHDLLVVSDEVYEHMTFDGLPHVPIATLPGMWERTLTISSAGKTFALTGWKIGWCCGPAEIVGAVRAAKQFLTYVSGAPLQPAIAQALAMPDEYYADIAADLQRKRDLLRAGLVAAGFAVNDCRGTYFLSADARSVGYDDGIELCRDLPGRCGVVAVPMSVFYDDLEQGRPLVRFAFCKRDDVLAEAADRLSRLTT